MTIAGLTLRGSNGISRWLLLGSLALNLFFIGIGGALLMRSYAPDSPAASAAKDRSMAGRVERIAARLPQEDAERLRAAFQRNREPIERARAAYYDRQDVVRSALRSQPFELDALRAALTDMRSARQVSDRQFHDFFAQQAADMSATGRQKLADWSSRRAETNQQPKH
jgi:uncharacterized membrane protein